MKKLLLTLLFCLIATVAFAAGMTSILPASIGSDTLNTSGTRYLCANGIIGDLAAESQANFLCSTAGTFKNLRVVLGTATGEGTTRIFTVRKNSANTTLTLTIANPDLSGADTAHTFTVAAGDTVTISSAVTGTPAASSCNYSLEFLSDNDGESCLSYNSAATSLSASETEYLPLSGVFSGIIVTESMAVNVMPESATIKNLFVVLDTAPGGDASRIFTVKKNGVDTALTCTIATTAITANDSANSFTVAAGDTICVSATLTGTPATSPVRIGITYDSDTNGNFIVTQNCDDGSTGALNPAATEYFATSDGCVMPDATETTHQQAYQSCTIKKMYVNLTVAPGVGNNYAFTLQKNTSPMGLVTTITDTSIAGNATADIAIADNDLLDTMVVPTSTPDVSRSTVTYLVTLLSGATSAVTHRNCIIYNNIQ